MLQKKKGKFVLALSYQAVGVIFGDLGRQLHSLSYIAVEVASRLARFLISVQLCRHITVVYLSKCVLTKANSDASAGCCFHHFLDTYADCPFEVCLHCDEHQ